MNASRLLDDKTKCAIEAVLSKGDRVELVPVKDGVKIIHIKREEVKLWIIIYVINAVDFWGIEQLLLVDQTCPIQKTKCIVIDVVFILKAMLFHERKQRMNWNGYIKN